MNHKKLKYLDLLAKIQNCPPSNCNQINANIFRWVHEHENENDFKPVNLIKSPPPRMLDDTDKLCMGYGLSMFDTLENALGKYKKLYLDKRVAQRQIFVEDMGTVIANVRVTEQDGVATQPHKTNYGHFTFYECEGIDLRNNCVDSFDIFEENGELKS